MSYLLISLNTIMKNCWSPWYYYDSVKSGSKACAATTIFFSTFSIIYICHCLNEGDSSQFFLPLFETDVNTSKFHSLCNFSESLQSLILSLCTIRVPALLHRTRFRSVLSADKRYFQLINHVQVKGCSHCKLCVVLSLEQNHR